MYVSSMAESGRRRRSRDEGGGGSSNADFEPSMDEFPLDIVAHVLEKLDLGSLCTAACVSPAFNSAVAQLLPSLSSLDLSVGILSG